MGRHHPRRSAGIHRDPARGPHGRAELTPIDELLREHWGSAVATVTRQVGDLGAAEDAVQDACAAALVQWPVEGTPANPAGWLVTVARRRAIDALRREGRRAAKEEAAMQDAGGASREEGHEDDDLGLILLCCHPALDPAARIALTLRSVCGLTTTEIAAAFLLPEPTMAKRLTRAKAKIRDAGIVFKAPSAVELSRRLPAVLRVIYLVFTEGHMATAGDALVRGELCDTAVGLARALVARLPDEPEVLGLLALLLLTDARRAARIDDHGRLVVLDDQDRTRWDAELIAEGEALVERALRMGRPGAYQLHASIAACHSGVAAADATDWRQIALLYAELVRFEPTPVVEANRAVAVAMSEGPAAGLVILDAVAHDPQLQRWPQLHVARAELLRRAGRTEEAATAFRLALQLEPPPAERDSIARRLAALAP